MIYRNYRSIISISILIVVFSCVKIEPERIFKVETGQAIEITDTNWLAKGVVLDLGSQTISEHGFCYSTLPNPTILSNDGLVELGGTSATGEFTGAIAGLDPGTTYYLRAFLTNPDSTTYGMDYVFTTKEGQSLPVVITSPAASVTETSAVVGGNVSSDGGSEVTDRGIYYGTSPDPKTTGTKIQVGSGTGAFSTTLTGLTDGNLYYYVAYAINNNGTSYGTTLQFVTGQSALQPSVTTSSPAAVTETSAQVGGNVSADGGATVTERGIYYGTSSDPGTNGTKVVIGSGLGTFTTTLTGLTASTTYYYVAYATNSAGTAFGANDNFTTGQTILKPTVTTTDESSVLPHSAELGGNVTSDGGATVTERGVYYSTSSDPESSGTKVAIGSGTGSFSANVTGLADNTKYYFIAYATNSAGTGYGGILSFTTPVDNTVTDYDGNVYQTVVIGSQTWMTENLRSTHYADGTAILLMESTSGWMNLGDTEKAYCFYNNEASNADPYGALYNWAGAMNGASSSDAVPSGVQGVCPDGWHLPSDEEWKLLAIHLGMSRAEADGTLWRGSDEGGKLKEAGYAHWQSPNSGATNESGFTAIPGGSRSTTEGAFDELNRFSRMHSSTEATEIATTHVWRHAVGYNETKFQRNYYLKGNGFSVRCVQD